MPKTQQVPSRIRASISAWAPVIEPTMEPEFPRWRASAGVVTEGSKARAWAAVAFNMGRRGIGKVMACLVVTWNRRNGSWKRNAGCALYRTLRGNTLRDDFARLS